MPYAMPQTGAQRQARNRGPMWASLAAQMRPAAQGFQGLAVNQHRGAPEMLGAYATKPNPADPNYGAQQRLEQQRATEAERIAAMYGSRYGTEAAAQGARGRGGTKGGPKFPPVKKQPKTPPGAPGAPGAPGGPAAPGEPAPPQAPPSTPVAYNLEGDPEYQRARLAYERLMADSEASLVDQQKQLLLGLGSPELAGSLFGNDPIATAAGANPMSILAQLRKQNDAATEGINERDFAGNLFYSTARGGALGDQQSAYQGAQQTALTEAQQQLAGLRQSYLSTQNEGLAGLFSALSGARDTAIDDAQRYGLAPSSGDPSAGTTTDPTAPSTAGPTIGAVDQERDAIRRQILAWHRSGKSWDWIKRQPKAKRYYDVLGGR